MCSVLFAASAGAALQSPAAQTQAPAPPASDEEALDSRLARWRESLDLDEPAAVLSEGRALVAVGGALANDAHALGLVARALVSSGEPEAARELLARGTAAKPAEVLLAERARFALGEDDLQSVLELLWDAQANTLRLPATDAAYLLVGRARARLGEWERAAPLLRRYLELQPLAAEAPSAWHLLAQEALRRGDTARARFCAEREDSLGRWHAYYRARRLQIRESPREPLPRLGLAQLWLEVEDLAKARAVLDELVVLAPEFARGWMALGETQRKQGELDGALRSYERALQLDPKLDIARLNRAMIAKLQARDADARRDLELLLQGPAGHDPRFAHAHLELARLYVKAGERELGLAAFARYREMGGKESL